MEREIREALIRLAKALNGLNPAERETIITWAEGYAAGKEHQAAQQAS